MTTLQLMQLLIEADPTGEREVKFYDHTSGGAMHLGVLTYCPKMVVAHFLQRDEIEEAAVEPLRKDSNDTN
jgi:hypothetical protein